MMWHGNREKLYATFSMKEQADLREALAGAGIDYELKTKDHSSPSPLYIGTRARGILYGIQTQRMLEYTFFVKKEDLSEAMAVLERCLHPSI